jgi:hypothetical protein
MLPAAMIASVGDIGLGGDSNIIAIATQSAGLSG